jgi:acetolactate synthase-1/2/3 large subunit
LHCNISQQEGAIKVAHLTGGQAVVAALEAHGVNTIFGIPGVHTLPLYDALRDTTGIRHVLGRHEQGVGFMADGYARISGKVGVASTITGPGVTNIATPVADAYADSIPLLVIASSLPAGSRGRAKGELHEIKDQFGMMEALSGWTRRVDFVEEIPEAIRDAFRALQMGRPRGAYIEIPLDVLAQRADVQIMEPAPITLPQPTEAQITELAQLLGEARRPLIIAGRGVTASGANAQLVRLAERLGAPVLLDDKNRDTLPTEHPLVIASSGYGVPRELRALVSDSDVVLVLGSKLSEERTGRGKLHIPGKIAQVDIDPAEIGRQYPVALGIVSDVRLALDALLGALKDSDGEWVARTEEVNRVREALAGYAQRAYGDGLPFLDAVRAGLPEHGIVVADMTMLGYASGEYFPVYAPRTYIHPSELCAIGCGLPLALGAKAAAPEQPVVALCGDGGFLLNAGELATAVQEQLDVVVVIFNDATYSAVKFAQRRSYERRYIATDLVAPDYVALAQAFGIQGVKTSTPEELQACLQEATGRRGSTLIEVLLPPRQW